MDKVDQARIAKTAGPHNVWVPANQGDDMEQQSDSITLLVENVMGIREAEIHLPAGTTSEVRSRNSTGKTSLAVALRAVLSQDVDPLNFGRGRVGYRRENAEKGTVLMVHGDRRIRWVAGENAMSVEGMEDRTAEAMTIALGGYDFAAGHSEMERVGMMRVLFGDRTLSFTDPAMRQEVTAATDELWLEMIEEATMGDPLAQLNGEQAEAAEHRFKAWAREGKRKWEELTGERYGSVKAANWRPEAWAAALAGKTLEDLEAEVKTLVTELNDRRVMGAVSEERAKVITKARLDLKEAEAQHAELSETETELNNVKLEAQQAMQKCQQRVGETSAKLDRKQQDLHRVTHLLTCPTCAAQLLLIGDELVDPEQTEGWMPDTIRKEVAALEGELESRVGDQRQADAAFKAADQKANEARSAMFRNMDRMSNLETAAAGSTEIIVETMEMRQKVKELEARLEVARTNVKHFLTVEKAQHHHLTVARYTQMAKVVSPKSAYWTSESDTFRRAWDDTLRALCAAAGWPEVAMDDTGAVKVAGRPVQLCSGSERWIAHAICCLTAAAMTGIKVVILDSSEILDADRRDGLDRILMRCNAKGMHTLVCTASGQDEERSIPFLEAADVWYRFNEGVLEVTGP